MRFWLNWGAGLVASMIAVPALAAGQQPIDAESMEVFFDRVWEESLSHDGVVPGAVITVVHEGEVVFNKGYGTRGQFSERSNDQRIHTRGVSRSRHGAPLGI